MASQSAETNNPLEFPSFPKLPKEIRLMIWKNTLPGPRIFEIKYHHGNYEDDGPIMQGYFDYDFPLPIEFTACQESRQEFKKQYTISFPRMLQGPRIYFDPSVDTLVIGKRTSQSPQNFTNLDLVFMDPLVYPGGDVFSEIENICFTSFTLTSALHFLRDVSLLDGYLQVKTIVVAVESEERAPGEAHADIIPLGNTAKPGQPWLEEAQHSEEEQQQCTAAIGKFLSDYTKEFPLRVVPKVKVMVLLRHKIRSN